MDNETAAAHLVIVYPQDKAEAAQLARALVNSLTAACGGAPLLIRPDITALCLLVRGRLATISKAVDEVTDAYSRWLVVPVGTTHAANGLSTADQWLLRQH